MADLGLAGGGLEAFQVGQQLGGTSGLSVMVSGLVERAKNLELLKQKAQFDVASQVEAKRQTAPIEQESAINLEKAKSGMVLERAKAVLQQLQGGQGGVGAEGGPPLEGYSFNPVTGDVNVKYGYQAPANEQIKQFQEYDRVTKQLEEILTDFDRNQYGTGPFSARFQRGKLANVYAQGMASTEEIQFRDKVFRWINDYLAAQTGAQRGFKEIAYIEPTVINPGGDRPDVFRAKVLDIINQAKRNKSNMVKQLGAFGVRTEGLMDSVSPDESAPSLQALVEEKARRQRLQGGLNQTQ